MDEALIDAVVRRVLARQEQTPALPAALLIGRRPERELGWRYGDREPYEAVVIGSLGPAELLQFPDSRSCRALLEGKPVYLCPEGLEHRSYAASAGRSLWAKLLAAERGLRQLGVQVLPARGQGIVTAQELRRRLESGQSLSGRLTPLARDLLQEHQCRSGG